MKKASSLFLWWIPPALVITLFAGLIYVTAQQILRQDANDPQIQIAEDMSGLLASGVAPQNLISAGVPTEISKSLATFASIYDDSGTLVISTGTLQGKPISLSQGVFDYVKQHGEDRITWQPEEGVRSAVVVVRYTGAQNGYVVVGRSLREVEARERMIERPIIAVWLILLFISFIAVFFIHRREFKALETI